MNGALVVDEFDGAFERVCPILPERDADGRVVRHTPHHLYRNERRLRLHKYGAGPFCRFRIPEAFAGRAGVYRIVVDGLTTYVGECVDLASRFNQGYGLISPRNCFEGGQPTNCRINSFILCAVEEGSTIELLFLETKDRLSIESIMIRNLRPRWNRTEGSDSHRIEPTGEGQAMPMTRSTLSRSKYAPLRDHLDRLQVDRARLDLGDIEGILGFPLPPSARNRREWWANGGHSQAAAWLDAGWRVAQVDLSGGFVILERM